MKITKGMKFEWLTAIELLPDYNWLCQCRCGNRSIVKAWNLTGGHTTSCGCRRYNPLKLDFSDLEQGQGNTFWAICNMYLSDVLVADSTKMGKYSILKNLKPLHNVPITDITPDMITSILVHYNDCNYYSSSYQYMIYGLIAMVFDYAVKHGYVKNNVVRGLYKRKKSYKDTSYLNRDDVHILLRSYDTSNPSDYIIYVLLSILYYTGMRICEAVALTKQDVNINNKQITVCKDYVYRTHTLVNRTKTDRDRIIMIPSTLCEVLRDYLNTLNNDTLFANDGRYISATTIKTRFKKHLKMCDLKDVSVYSLRHSHINAMMQVSPQVSNDYVNSLAGHCGNSRETLMSHYYMGTGTEKMLTESLEKI